MSVDELTPDRWLSLRLLYASPDEATVELALDRLPDAEDPTRREQDDHEKDDADHGVEPLVADADVAETGNGAEVVVEDDEDKGTDPGALEPVETADHRDDQEVDDGREIDRRRVDVVELPDVEDPGDRGDERAEAERDRPVQRHVVAERAHADGVVANALEGDPEGAPRQVAHQRVEEDGRDQG